MALVVMSLNFLLVKPYFLQWSKFNDTEIANLFIIFGLFIFVIAIDNVSSTFLSALKFNRMPTIVSIGQGIIGLTIGYFFLPVYGVAGVAMASIIALSCTSLLFNPAYLLFKIRGQLANR
jgi:Na+-driven multidrug efflux pump